MDSNVSLLSSDSSEYDETTEILEDCFYKTSLN